jgi:hypothetical protein
MLDVYLNALFDYLLVWIPVDSDWLVYFRVCSREPMESQRENRLRYCPRSSPLGNLPYGAEAAATFEGRGCA